ncbi:hypothetical protein LUZ62_036431 [Rhynchospora pubera]|uniref:DUF4408 domain-containing protein n=1 Tax=Rhynchospora pubera TaxID=906938 RepID=A0AAV8EYF8_9POAL|nr:hypothetical protein LUZ62_062571 [Rhynchospora pubera]KAJ4785185.1 hypothetical protein LUZ62_036431 [Rhynchospora pubera]
MANFRQVSNGFLSSLSGLQIGLILVSAISLFILAMLSIPHISGLSVALLEIWSVLSAWLAPPYLFIAVHFIILVIWKLDQKPPRDHPWAPHQNQQPVVKPKQQLISPEISRGIIPNKAEEWAPPGEPAVTVPKHNLSGEVLSPGILRGEEPDQHFQWDPPAPEEQTLPKQRLSREISPKKKSPNVSRRGSLSNESCLTEDESTASSRFEIRRSERPQMAPDREIVRQLEPDVGEEEPAVIEEGEIDVDDSMDATWKAIMEKTPRPVVPTPRRGAPEMETSVGADEMNRRFEDFIKKSRDQIRLQGEEPRRRQIAMANAAF